MRQWLAGRQNQGMNQECDEGTPVRARQGMRTRREVLRAGLLAAGASALGAPRLRGGSLLAGGRSTLGDRLRAEQPAGRRAGAAATALRVGTMVTTQSMDPLLGLGGSALAAVFDSLTAIDPLSHAVAPGLASSWRRLSATETDFELARGAVFSDGSAVSPGDVSFSLAAELASDSPLAGLLEGVQSVTPAGTATVRVVTATPDPLLMRRLATAAVLSQQAYASARSGSPPPLIGSGRYVLSGFQPAGSVSLSANPRSWLGPAPAAYLVVSEAVTEEGLLVALSNGQLDVAEDLPAGAPDELARRCEVESRPIEVVSCVLLDASSGPFADDRVRLAASLSLDVPSLIATLFGGAASPLSGQLAPEGCVGYDPALPAIAYDPAEARRLLSAAGHPGGIDTELAGPADQAPLLEALAGQLAVAGIRAAVTRLDTLAWGTAIRAGGRHPMLLAQFDLAPLFDIGPAYRAITGRGVSGFRPIFPNAAFTRLDAEQAVELDSSRRATLLTAMARHLHAELPALPLFGADWLYGHWPYVSGLVTLGPQLVLSALQSATV